MVEPLLPNHRPKPWNPGGPLLLVRTTLFFGCVLGLMAQSDSSPASSDEGYSGPAILSRGETPGAQTAAPIAFRPYIGLSGIYDTGLVPVSVTSTGGIPSSDLYGVELNLGAYTYHVWKHTTLGLDYRGDPELGCVWSGANPGRIPLSRLEAHPPGAGLPGGFPALLHHLLGRHRSIPVAHPHAPAPQARDVHAAEPSRHLFPQ